MPRENQHTLMTFGVLAVSHDDAAMPHGPNVLTPFLFRNFVDYRLDSDAFDTPDTPVFFQPPTSGTGPTPPFLPVFSWDQAAAQLTRESQGWSPGPGAVVTYGFRSSIAPDDMPDGTSGFSQFSAAQIAATEAALQLWSDVANISFVRANPGGYTNSATMLFANYFRDPAEESAFAFFPGSTAASAVNGDVWVNLAVEENSDLTFGTFGPHILAHEIGHAIGISHPGPYNAGAGDEITYEDDAVYWQDARAFTVMSYFGSLDTVGHSLNGFAAGPQLHDIAAAQRLYGANMSTRTGNTVYGFNSNTGLQHYTIAADGASPVFAIWDAGGIDTLDLSGYSTSVEIDLREEAFSSAGPGNQNTGLAHGNIAIARGAVIENGAGGAGADVIIGNAAANRLTGNGGADAIDGLGGVDTAVYTDASTASTWTRNLNGSWTVTSPGGGADGVSNVEFLDFTDRDVFLDRAVHNFFGDGTSDILFRRFSDGVTVIWTVNGAVVTSAAPTQFQAGSEWSLQGFGDFNSDGRDDFLLRRNADGVTAVWTMNGTSVVAANVTTWQAGLQWQIQRVGDFNGDGRDDFLWRRTSDGVTSVWNMNGATVVSADVTNWQAGLEWTIQGVGDFNGDGRDDFLWRRASDGVTAIWMMNGTAVQSADVTTQTAGAEWSFAGVGDFNGDGLDDLLLRRDDGVISIWTMNGTNVLSAGVASQQADASWQIAAVGDYSGDGKDDLLLRHDGDGLLAIWVMNGAIVASATLTSQQAGAEWGII